MRLWNTIYVFFYSVTLIATQRKKLPPLQTLFCKTASCQLTLLIGFCFFSNYDLLVLPAAQHCVFKAWVYMKFLSKSSPWKGRYVIRSFNTCAFFFFVISCSSQQNLNHHKVMHHKFVFCMMNFFKRRKKKDLTTLCLTVSLKKKENNKQKTPTTQNPWL